jgi:hypothetical protein
MHLYNNPDQVVAIIDIRVDDAIKTIFGLLNTPGDQHVIDVSCFGSERTLEMVKKLHGLFTLGHDPVVDGPAFLVSVDKKDNVGHYVDLCEGKPTPPPGSPEKLKENIEMLKYECDPVLYMTKEAMDIIFSKDDAKPDPKRHKA